MKEEFNDIAPYDDSVFQQYMSRLVKEPGFENAIKYVMPDANYHQVVSELLKIRSKNEFQHKIMYGILLLLEKKTTSGVTDSGFENIDPEGSYLYITNHRDIVLDASFLGLAMIRRGWPAQEVALGDNLLIYEWIEDLVRLNKGIIVKRNLRLTKALEAAKQLSGYIRYCIGEKHESVWLAQREGRAKDSNDVTQESVIKMLALSGEGTSVAEKLMALNILPTAISYEYDPNDYLKAREFLARRRDPEFKKSQRDDLFSMETGILQFKGQVHFAAGRCINDRLKELLPLTDKVEIIRKVCALIDNEIHRGYKIFPVNYIAYDRVNGTTEFSDRYTETDVRDFDAYLNSQLDKVDLPDITAEERGFMFDSILTMYANPLRNKIHALTQTADS
ncbi:MAG: acyltransferase [Bacteroidales bacterium]|nr:acyltransferase [Bacteroidales bacterium]